MNLKKGFTLIELLVVISIISLLSSVIFASLRTARTKALGVVSTAAVDQYITALNIYYLDNNAYPYPFLVTPICLGRAPCQFSSASFNEDAGFVAMMNPYLPGVPSVGNQIVSINTGQGIVNYQGGVYRCTTNEVNTNKCLKYEIDWAVVGPSAKCGQGSQLFLDVSTGSKVCYFNMTP